MTDIDSREIGEEFVEHFGVKGMHWGVRRDPDTGVRPIAKSLDEGPFGRAAKRNVDRHNARVAKKAVKADNKWIKNVAKPKAYYDAVNKANDGFDRDIVGINNSDKYRGKDLRQPSKLRTQYYRDVSKMYQRHLDAVANDIPHSPSGNYRFTLRAPNYNDLLSGNSQGGTGLPDVIIVENDVQHANTDAPKGVGTIKIKYKWDDIGHCVSASTPDFVAVTHGEEFVEHYGIKGMQWGVRREALKSSKAKARDDARSMSTDDLKAAISRMELEKKFVSLADLSNERNYVQELLAKHGDKAIGQALTAVTTTIVGLGIAAIFRK